MDFLTKVGAHELEWTAVLLERITIPRNCKTPLAYISSVIKKTTLKMSEHRSVCGSDGGFTFLQSIDQMVEDLQKGKDKLGVLETQTKHLGVHNDLLDARMKLVESKLSSTSTQLRLKDSEIDSLRDALRSVEDRMNRLDTIRQSEIDSQRDALGAVEDRMNRLDTIRQSEIDSQRDALRAVEDRMNRLDTIRQSEIDSLQETLHAYEEQSSSLSTLVARVDKTLVDLESGSTSRQPFQTESSYQRFMEYRLYELECEAFGATNEHNKRSRHEFIHGGSIHTDIQAIEGVSMNAIRYLRVREGFQNCYGISVSHFKEVFQDAPLEVSDTLDKRMNLRKIKFWQGRKNIQTRDKLISIANEIIEKWETGFHGALNDLYGQLTQQYDDCMWKD